MREKAFRRLHEELPYELRFGASQVDEFPDGSVRIEVPLLVGDERVRRRATPPRAAIPPAQRSGRPALWATRGWAPQDTAHVSIPCVNVRTGQGWTQTG